MKAIVVNDDNLTIVLTQMEISEYNSKNGEDFENILEDVLTDASKKSGFDISRGSFFVGVFLSENGDCQMFVERGKSTPEEKSISEEDTDLMRYIYEKERGQDVSTTSADNRKKLSVAYRFNDFEMFLSVCKMICLTEPGIKSRTFCSPVNEEYFILLPVPSPIALEMGADTIDSSQIRYIYEYCTEICPGNLKKLSNFAI